MWAAETSSTTTSVTQTEVEWAGVPRHRSATTSSQPTGPSPRPFADVDGSSHKPTEPGRGRRRLGRYQAELVWAADGRRLCLHAGYPRLRHWRLYQWHGSSANLVFSTPPAIAGASSGFSTSKLRLERLVRRRWREFAEGLLGSRRFWPNDIASRNTKPDPVREERCWFRPSSINFKPRGRPSPVADLQGHLGRLNEAKASPGPPGFLLSESRRPHHFGTK